MAKRKTENLELKRLMSALKRIDNQLLALRTSAVEHDERREAAQKIYKAIDRQKDFARREGIVDVGAWARLDGLRPQVAIAVDQASSNYNAENLRQMAELENRIRERNANQGGFEKELELMRGGRKG